MDIVGGIFCKKKYVVAPHRTKNKETRWMDCHHEQTPRKKIVQICTFGRLGRANRFLGCGYPGGCNG